MPVHLETIMNPERYSVAQKARALRIAAVLNRGKFVLAEPPRR